MAAVARAYRAAPDSAPRCPSPPSACRFQSPIYPCTFDSSDVPFNYFEALRDKPQHMRDYSALQRAVSAGTLPQFSFVKFLGFNTEHVCCWVGVM
jgi:hypothetical protein